MILCSCSAFKFLSLSKLAFQLPQLTKNNRLHTKTKTKKQNKNLIILVNCKMCFRGIFDCLFGCCKSNDTHGLNEVSRKYEYTLYFISVSNNKCCCKLCCSTTCLLFIMFCLHADEQRESIIIADTYFCLNSRQKSCT